MIIRAEQASDRAAIHAVNAQAFGRDNEARLIDLLRSSPAFIAELSLVAIDAAQVVGHILFSRIHIRTPGRDVPALALAPMAVLPERHHQGIGSALIRSGLDACRRLGHQIVIVVGHPRYYPRFGFLSASAKGLEAPYPDAAFMVQELTPGALTGVRGVVEYPAAFSAV
jgi:putative acetyltransferase